MKRSIKIGRETADYSLICSRNRSTLLLQALPEGRIRLYAPAGIPLKAADGFVKEHYDEIKQAHRRFDAAVNRSANGSFPDSVSIEGKRIPIKVHKSSRRLVNFQNDCLIIDTDLNDNEEILKQLKRALNEFALRRFTYYLKKWGPSIGYPYGRVTVREQKTRWGSCSSKNNLNFNWKLIMAPTQVLEYVVIHELCHLIHFNHSALFWKEVSMRMPDYDIWKGWLKKNGRLLTLG